ncbi:hypothetical protein J4466_02630 [Candidatus Pacearchaeota archaeon]|nr:hypothetical protein [Candidatus Pacearchaeota archaeon]
MKRLTSYVLAAGIGLGCLSGCEVPLNNLRETERESLPEKKPYGFFVQDIHGITTTHMVTGDFDGDGDLDVLISGRHYRTAKVKCHLLENDGKGNFNVK